MFTMKSEVVSRPSVVSNDFDYSVDGSEFESLYCDEFSPLHIFQTGSGAHPASYTTGTGALPWGVKRQGYATDHSLPANAEVKIMWIYTSTPPYAFME
jgi:hypothetical protein